VAHWPKHCEWCDMEVESDENNDVEEDEDEDEDEGEEANNRGTLNYLKGLHKNTLS